MKEVPDRNEAYEKALNLLRKCSTKYGFIAAAENPRKYNRIWGRDSIICSFAAMLSGDKELIETSKASLHTLMRFQHKHGMIPSNVDVKNKDVSYGGSAGRIDSTLWFMLGFANYYRHIKDKNFLDSNYSHFKKAFDLVHLYDFNDKGFIYIPKGGDWADEYIQEGYVLYDELLYCRSMKDSVYLRKQMGKKIDSFGKKRRNLRKMLVKNYWLEEKNSSSKYIYNKLLFDKYADKRKYTKNYLLPFFNPSGYGFRFDGFGNSLALHFGILPKEKRKMLLDYISKNFSSKTNFLIPAFWPAITRQDSEWNELKHNFSVKFRNKPYNYHNAGLWPMVTGFFASALAEINREKAKNFLDGINSANSKGSWGFYEFLNGKTLRPKGTKYQAWSAAASIIAYETIINKKRLFK